MGLHASLIRIKSNEREMGICSIITWVRIMRTSFNRSNILAPVITNIVCTELGGNDVMNCLYLWRDTGLK